MKRIGVLTSGGDAPGMNAAVRAVVRYGLHAGLDVVGIRRGYYGLIHDEIEPMTPRSVADIIHRGGTFLRTARSEEFMTPTGQKQALDNLEKHGIDGLVVIGGGGSLKGAIRLCELGMPVIGVPATIDNDQPGTDYSIGFDTAVNTVIDAINKIRDTATSHDRIYVVETMGRDSGFIALNAGLAGGAEAILVPEIPFDLDEVCHGLVQSYKRGKAHSIILVAEGIFGAPGSVSSGDTAALRVGKYIQERTGFENRITLLGHLQRGGNPTALDRILASRLGARAVELLLNGQKRLMVGMVNNRIEASPLDEVTTYVKKVDRETYELAVKLASL
ncbi:MAG: 6-phosphofructokinase [Limnochordia bacterium]